MHHTVIIEETGKKNFDIISNLIWSFAYWIYSTFSLI